MHGPILISAKKKKLSKFNLRSLNLCWIFLILFIFILGLLFPFRANAQDISPSLSVSPHTFELDVLPGEIRTEKIKIGNKSEVAIPITVKLVDFSAAEDSGEMLFDEALQDPSIASRKWFEIENPNFILDVGETKEVQFLINVPEDAEPGGHYSVMLFEPQLPSFYFKEGQARAIPVIGVLFLFSVKTFVLEPEVQQKLEIVEFSPSKEERLIALENLISGLVGSIAQAAAPVIITEKSPSNFILRIKNNDIYHIKPFGKVLIYNTFGKKVGETEVSQRTILPGKTRQFPVEFSPEVPEKLKWLPASISNFLVQNFFIGRYQAELELEAKSPLTAEILRPDAPIVLTFFSLPWKFWLSFIFIFGLLIFLTIKYRKRIKTALKILFSKPKYRG